MDEQDLLLTAVELAAAVVIATATYFIFKRLFHGTSSFITSSKQRISSQIRSQTPPKPSVEDELKNAELLQRRKEYMDLSRERQQEEVNETSKAWAEEQRQ